MKLPKSVLTRLQKNWLRLAGIMVLAYFAVGWGLERINRPLSIKEVRQTVLLNGFSGDFFCRSFLERLEKNAVASSSDQSESAARKLIGGFRDRMKASIGGATRDRHIEASISGRMYAHYYLQKINDPLQRQEATVALRQTFADCETRLVTRGTPAPPTEPKPGSGEWYLRNR